MNQRQLLKKIIEWKKVMTYKEIADQIGYGSASTVNQWVTRGRIPQKAQGKLNVYLGLASKVAK